REIVERRIPLRARIGLVRKDELTAARWHSHRLCPRIELCFADRGDDAADGEIVCAARSLVVGIAVELMQGDLRRAHVFTKCYEWVSTIALCCFDDFRLRICQRADAAGKWNKPGAPFAHLGIGRATPEGARRDDG